MKTVSPFSVNHASDYSRGQSIWRGAGLIVCSLKGLREQEEMLGGGVGWGGGYLRWTSVLFKGRGESTILPDALRCRDRDEL